MAWEKREEKERERKTGRGTQGEEALICTHSTHFSYYASRCASVLRADFFPYNLDTDAQAFIPRLRFRASVKILNMSYSGGDFQLQRNQLPSLFRNVVGVTILRNPNFIHL